jgi:outer membrane protein insertion porin family
LSSVLFKKNYIFFIIAFLGLVFGFIPKAFSYSEIKIEGLSRLSREAVISNLVYDNNKDITEKQLAEEVEALYKTNFFSDISASYEKGVLNLKVLEVPIVASVKFNGLKQFKKDDLMKELIVKERTFYSKTAIISDAKKIEAVYKTLGILDATVDPMIEFKEGGKVFVIFNIFEGNKRKIKKISFEGNDSFSDGTLKDVLSFKEKKFFRIFSGSTGYNITYIINELGNLKRFYMTKGYAKFELVKHFVSVGEKENEVDIYIFVKEGQKYNFNEVSLKNNIPALKDFSDQDLKKIITFKKGSRFNLENIDGTKYKINQILQKEGFLLSVVDVSYEYNDEKGEVNVTFTINPTKRLYVNKINIFGNLKTNDNVIRREFLLSEGDVYDVEKIRRSVQRLRNLQYFEDIQVKENQSSFDRMDLNIIVSEKSTIQADFAVSYDFGSQIGANVSLTESNLFGTGIITGISVEKSRYSQAISLSVTEPYLLGRDLSLSGSLSHSSQDNSNISAYKSSSNSFNIRAGYSLTEYLRHSVGYSLSQDNLTIFNRQIYAERNPVVLEQEGNFITSSVGHIIFLDKRDNSYLPNDGYSIKFSQNVAGIGGNVKYIQNELTMERHFPLFNIDNSVLSFKVRGGYITGYGGEDVKIKDRYSLGGNNGLRGFDFQGVAPKIITTDPVSKDTLYFNYGGKTLFVGNIEYRFPNFLPPELGFSTFLFYDFGTVFGYDDPSKIDANSILDSDDIRSSIGIGISWRTVIGVIGISYAKPLRKKEFDETRPFFLNIGGFNF